MSSNRKPPTGKAPLRLIPASAKRAIAAAFEDGLLPPKNYGEGNWSEGDNTEAVKKYTDALQRHVDAFADPTEDDYAPDSKVHHLAHAGACLMILLHRLGIDYPARAVPHCESEDSEGSEDSTVQFSGAPGSTCTIADSSGLVAQEPVTCYRRREGKEVDRRRLLHVGRAGASPSALRKLPALVRTIGDLGDLEQLNNWLGYLVRYGDNDAFEDYYEPLTGRVWKKRTGTEAMRLRASAWDEHDYQWKSLPAVVTDVERFELAKGADDGFPFFEHHARHQDHGAFDAYYEEIKAA